MDLDSYATKSQLEDTDRALRASIFVIPSVNGAQLLRRMIPSLGIPPRNIIVLDQSSTDDTTSYCKKRGIQVIQLGSPKTYTQCCNIAIKIASEREAPYFFFSNNDIEFVTDVAREMIFEMIQDDGLGALSCSQLIVDEHADVSLLSNNVYWDLDSVIFEHDTGDIGSDVYRRDTDFCEFTCVLLRTKAALEIGGADDEFGFYHEDADFCIRLREAGYTTAYLLQSQFKHFAGSTFKKGLNEQRLRYLENSKSVFAKKHLGYGFAYHDHKSEVASSWNVINQYLYRFLSKSGMIDMDRPELIFSHPGERPFDFLYSVWETSALPRHWLEHSTSYRGLILPSSWNFDVFDRAGFSPAYHVPLGVDTDVFTPSGPREYLAPGKTFVWFARNQYRKGLDVMLGAWRAFRRTCPDATLVILGHGVLEDPSVNRSDVREFGGFLIYNDRKNNICYRQTLRPISPPRLASIYRGADCIMLTSRSEGFGFSVIEAMACGTPVIFPDYGGTKDMIHKDALTFSGELISADYSDKEFTDVGDWWEPISEGIVDKMIQIMRMSAGEKDYLRRHATNKVWNEFTWRKTVFGLRNIIKRDQDQRDVDWRNVSRDNLPRSVSMAEIAAATRKIDLRAKNLSAEGKEIEGRCIEFDRSSYIARYADVGVVNLDPLWHFIVYGWKEEREPSIHFSAKQYLAANVRVKELVTLIDSPRNDEACRSMKWKFFSWQIDTLKLQGKESNLSDNAFVQLLYRVFARRNPDEEGLRYYVGLLEAGMSRDSVVETLAISKEARRILQMDSFPRLLSIRRARRHFKTVRLARKHKLK